MSCITHIQVVIKKKKTLAAPLSALNSICHVVSMSIAVEENQKSHLLLAELFEDIQLEAHSVILA